MLSFASCPTAGCLGVGKGVVLVDACRRQMRRTPAVLIRHWPGVKCATERVHQAKLPSIIALTEWQGGLLDPRSQPTPRAVLLTSRALAVSAGPSNEWVPTVGDGL
jgi:hypothetical protein